MEKKEVKKIEVGKIYATRSACDWDCIFAFLIMKRTDKTVTIVSPHFGKKVKRVYEWYGNECIAPLGRSSMSPVLSADKTLDDVLKQG